MLKRVPGTSVLWPAQDQGDRADADLVPWHVLGWLLGSSLLNRASPRLHLARPVCRALLAGLQQAVRAADGNLSSGSGAPYAPVSQGMHGQWAYPLTETVADEVDPSNAEAIARVRALGEEEAAAMLELEEEDSDEEEGG